VARRELVKHFDLVTIFLYAALVLIGWAMVYSSEYDVNAPKSIFSTEISSGKQFYFLLLALAGGIMAIILESKFYRAFAYGFYAIGILGLLLVLVFAKEINGARAWLNFGAFSFQAGEFGKMTTALALAAFLGDGHNAGLLSRQAMLKAIGIIALPMAIIILQNDTGSMLVYAFLLAVLFRAGFPAIWYALGAVLVALSILALYLDSPEPLVAVLLAVGSGVLLSNMELRQGWWAAFAFFSAATLAALGYGFYWTALAANAALLLTLMGINWRKKWQLGLVVGGIILVASTYTYSINYIFNKVLQKHQQTRILVWLRPDKLTDKSARYNVRNSLDAIRLGDVMGKGYLHGERAKLHGGWVPESNTDFIFCTIGEEQGFLGTSLVILIYLALLLRIVFIAERQRSFFSKFYAYGIASVLFAHVFINIGMTVGLMPVIGIPLPFISYGGSSLISFTIMLAILLRLDSNRLLVFR
jgi:rod shape determining protein RodA